QARGERTGPAADVYALGVILYELLTRKTPFRGDTPIDTLSNLLHAEPTPPRRLRAELPRDLETICLHCLHKEPARRYGSAATLAEDLRRFQAGEPIVARRVGRLERALKWARRHPAAATVAVLLPLVLLLGSAGAGFAWLWNEAEQASQAAGTANAKLQTALGELTDAKAGLENANSRLEVS